MQPCGCRTHAARQQLTNRRTWADRLYARLIAGNTTHYNQVYTSGVWVGGGGSTVSLGSQGGPLHASGTDGGSCAATHVLAPATFPRNMPQLLDGRKRQLVQPVVADPAVKAVLEIGVGSGANLPYYAAQRKVRMCSEASGTDTSLC
jgi:hypothetical protein